MRQKMLKSGGHQWLISVILGTALSALPVLAFGLGLGRLVVESGLDEPLNAHVRLIDPTPNELKTLSPSLAPRAVFDAAGVDRHHFLTRINYAIKQHKDGNYYIELSTDGPFREPFIQTLLEVDWAGGQLVREYNALLDPPHWIASQHPAILAPTVIAPAAQAATVPATVLPPAPAALSPEQQQTVTTPKPAAPPVSTTSTLLGPSGSMQAAATPAPQIPKVEANTTPAPERSSSWANTTQYTVRNGDTLSGIAHKITVDRNISPEQVMIALLRANPDAFFQHNINNLMSGKILKVPARKRVASVSKAHALKDFRVQYDAWQEYKVKLAAASHAMRAPSGSAQAAGHGAQSPAKASVAAKSKSAPNATAAQTKTAGTAANGSAGEALLSIVRSELNAESTGGQSSKSAGPATVKKGAAGERTVLSHKMTTLEEQIDARQQQNKELRQRVGKMRKQVQNTARLITIENRELALSEKQAAKPKPATAAAHPAAPKPLMRRPITKPLVRPSIIIPQPQSEGLIQGLVGDIFGNPLTLAMLGGVAALGVGILAMYYLRRRRAKAEFEESILSGGSLATDASSVSDSGNQAAASDTSFLSDFSQGGMGNIHTDEVDPIAEAEVYLAYGRDEQAEEILKEATVKDPHRQELKQKLLEIYLQRNDVVAFETLAEELYAQIEGKGGKVWEKVEEMGRKISPKNPMFRGEAPSRKTGAATDEMDMLEEMTRTTGPIMAGAATSMMSDMPQSAAPVAPLPETGGIDFNIASTAAPAAAGIGDTAESSAAPASFASVNFDQNLASTPVAAPVADVAQSPAAAADTGFDLDFSLEGVPSTGDANEISLDTATSTEGEPTLDFGTIAGEVPHADDGIAFLADADSGAPALEFESADEGSTEGQSQWDETTTKLDLAKAYIDMGDAEGARSILDEVMTEGNETQKNQARELATQIV